MDQLKIYNRFSYEVAKISNERLLELFSILEYEFGIKFELKIRADSHSNPCFIDTNNNIVAILPKTGRIIFQTTTRLGIGKDIYDTIQKWVSAQQD